MQWFFSRYLAAANRKISHSISVGSLYGTLYAFRRRAAQIDTGRRCMACISSVVLVSVVVSGGASGMALPTSMTRLQDFDRGSFWLSHELTLNVLLRLG